MYFSFRGFKSILVENVELSKGSLNTIIDCIPDDLNDKFTFECTFERVQLNSPVLKFHMMLSQLS